MVAVKDEKTKVRSAVLAFEHNQTCPAFKAPTARRTTHIRVLPLQGWGYDFTLLLCLYPRLHNTLSRIKHKKPIVLFNPPNPVCVSHRTHSFSLSLYRCYKAQSLHRRRLKQKLFTNTIIVLGLSRRQMAAIITQLESARTTFPLYYYHQTFVRTYEGTSQIAKLPSPFPIHHHHEQYSNSVQRKQFVKDICIPYYSYEPAMVVVTQCLSFDRGRTIEKFPSPFLSFIAALSVCLVCGLVSLSSERCGSDQIESKIHCYCRSYPQATTTSTSTKVSGCAHEFMFIF